MNTYLKNILAGLLKDIMQKYNGFEYKRESETYAIVEEKIYRINEMKDRENNKLVEIDYKSWKTEELAKELENIVENIVMKKPIIIDCIIKNNIFNW